MSNYPVMDYPAVPTPDMENMWLVMSGETLSYIRVADIRQIDMFEGDCYVYIKRVVSHEDMPAHIFSENEWTRRKLMTTEEVLGWTKPN